MSRKVDAETLISVVAPVYNEAETVEAFFDEVLRCLRELDFPGRFEIVLVNDGSSDGSAQVLDELAGRHPGVVCVIHLARNFGHAAAVNAGLAHARGDAVILMDSDMQDDPAAFSAFVAGWREGCDVVYAVRSSRTESVLSRILFRAFYRFLGWMANIRLPLDAGNFSLMDRRVIDALTSFPERNAYLPGLRAWVGLRQIGVRVPRRPRPDAKARVGLRGKWTLAMNAVFSFSYVPIFVFRPVGLLAILTAIAASVYALVYGLILGQAVAPWASQLITTSFFAGINLFGLSVIGEYVARIYDEVKMRPKYVVDRVTEADAAER